MKVWVVKKTGPNFKTHNSFRVYKSLPPASAENTKIWICTSTPPYAFMA
jgi:hypothetical protein